MGAIIHFGTDGWRARLDGDFTEENVIRVADAAGAMWSESYPYATVYIGYDTRPDAVRFARLAAQVISAHGLVAKLADRPTPAPAVSWAVSRDDRACGALIVTGSHLPLDYLGIKLRVADGGGGTTDFYEELEDAVEPDATMARGPVQMTDVLDDYLQDMQGLVDAEAIRDARLSVVCDPMYGSARGTLATVLRRLGVEVHEIHEAEDPDWLEFRPEPVEPWVDECEHEVVERGAWAGIVVDGDADRLGAVDERGRYVSPHKILALVLGHLVRDRGAEGRVVLNISSSTLARRVARALGCRITIKPNGFKHIYEEMLKGDVLLGGEGAGGIGIPAHILERDAMFCGLLLVELMAVTGRKLGELVDNLEGQFGPLCYGQRDLRLEPEVIESLRNVLPGLNPPEVAGREPKTVSHMDGLRLEFEDESWLLLRPGGTEPVVRVYAEAATVERRDELLDAGCDIARGEI